MILKRDERRKRIFFSLPDFHGKIRVFLSITGFADTKATDIKKE